MSQLDALYGYIVGALHAQSLEGSNLGSRTIAAYRGGFRTPRTIDNGFVRDLFPSSRPRDSSGLPTRRPR